MTSQDKEHTAPLSGQRVLVIGGASGIGRAVAAAAIAAGAGVTIAGRPGPRLDAAAAGLGVLGVGADIAVEAELAALFRDIGAAGPLDHLVITAGPLLGATPLADLDAATARTAFDVKVWGALTAVRLALPHLAATGSVTLTSGLLARKASPGAVVKVMMNAALEAAGRTLARELAPRRVNVVSPGVTDTDNWRAMPDDQRRAFLERAGAALPVGRVGEPEDLAAVYVLLMCNTFITGAVMDVEGGGLL